MINGMVSCAIYLRLHVRSANHDSSRSAKQCLFQLASQLATLTCRLKSTNYLHLVRANTTAKPHAFNFIFSFVVFQIIIIKYKICNGMLAASKSVVIYMFTNWNHYDVALMSYYSTSTYHALNYYIPLASTIALINWL